jgi:hypothetical protein
MTIIKRSDGLQKTTEACIRPAPPRICMPTWRNFKRNVFQCGLYEAQDILAEVEDVDLICLNKSTETTANIWLRKACLKNPLYDDVSRELKYVALGLERTHLSKDYDIFIAVFGFFLDLSYIDAIERWKDRCKISVCWIDELWAVNIPKYKRWLHLLSQFDYIFVGLKGSVAPLSQALNRPCYWLPGGIDAIRFSPFPNPPNRVVDVYSIGRRYEEVHRKIAAVAKRNEVFYVHDTLAEFASANAYDHRQHRDLFASMAKRSRYFIVAPAKMDAVDQTGCQVEIGYRYYEGAAAGAVMVGQVPDCEAYRELFEWSDVVIPIQPDGSDVMAVLGKLNADQERLNAISRRNTKEALLRHDWVYRWSEMFRVIGIQPSPRMVARKQRLAAMADFATCADKSCVSTAYLENYP